MAHLIDETFSLPGGSFFDDHRTFERWNIDREIALLIDPVVLKQGSNPLCRFGLPREVPRNKVAVTGFLTAEALIREQGSCIIRAEFRPLVSGPTGEHFGIFCRAHNPVDQTLSRRFGVAVQNGENRCGQCPGSSAFLQFTSDLPGQRESEYRHEFRRLDLSENPFTRGIGKRFRLEFEEIEQDGFLAWEGRVYLRTLLGWSLRGKRRVTELELNVRIPPLPSKAGIALGPGSRTNVDLFRFQVLRSDR